MGDCHILCAAAHVPIEPGSPAVGLLMSQTQPKYETPGAFSHKPCHYWRFVAGPFHVEETGDYTPFTDFENKVGTHREKLAHLNGMTEHPLAKGAIMGNKLVIPQRMDRPNVELPLGMVWFRKDVWEHLSQPQKRDCYWETFRRQLIEYALGKTDTIPEHLQEKESFLEKVARGKGRMETCRGDIAEAFMHSDLVDPSFVIHLAYWEKNPIENFLEGLLAFLPVEASCQQAGVTLHPNTYAQQEHWYNFEATRKLHELARQIDIRQMYEDEA